MCTFGVCVLCVCVCKEASGGTEVSRTGVDNTQIPNMVATHCHYYMVWVNFLWADVVDKAGVCPGVAWGHFGCVDDVYGVGTFYLTITLGISCKFIGGSLVPCGLTHGFGWLSKSCYSNEWPVSGHTRGTAKWMAMGSNQAQIVGAQFGGGMVV